MTRGTKLILSTCMLTLIFSAGYAFGVDIAIIDWADEWTKVNALGPSLEEYGYEYDDITGAAGGGAIELDGYNLLFLSAMYTNNPQLHQAMDNNADKVQAFVERGGVVIEPTQADQNEANVDWLPDGLTCVRSDPDPSQFVIEEPDHPVFNVPNKFTVADFLGWGHQGWPTGWEVIASQQGFDVLMVENGTNKPIIMEADYGQGKFVMMCLAPDKYHVAGNDDKTKEGAGKLFQNIMATWYDSIFAPVEPGGKLPVAWASLRR